ncbi:MAG: enoyl-CoA hydratase/isomerase family protein [Rhodobacterales bacterium CG_4_10_14_0_8_um_filter_70_9]|nr:MAG: enoyl-CoA hydratase/isomerase family protein [Rhodobacterales bacterium CG_4_10_14_0_8_um_filter_70_9]
MTAPILFEETGRLGLVTLNRPAQLNALTHDMALMLEERLLHWRGRADIACVAIIGAGPKAFCAGGDIRALYEAGVEDGAANFQFYADEYRLDTLIRRYPKPYVAFMDGIVMGGGVGVSIHGRFRIAGDATVFAMPETGIGLFPDVGGTWFLPRLPGQVGLWLGLTGARLKAADAVAAGVCDRYIPSACEGAALEALAAADYADDPRAAVGAALKPFTEAPSGGSLANLRPLIDQCFSGDSVEAVLAALDAVGEDWTAEQAAAIRAKSPTCTRIAFRQVRTGAALSFIDCMRLEYRLARFCMTHPDFYEGVRAILIDKTGAPQWRPATLAEADEAYVAPAFAPLPEDEELALPPE